MSLVTRRPHEAVIAATAFGLVVGLITGAVAGYRLARSEPTTRTIRVGANEAVEVVTEYVTVRLNGRRWYLQERP